MPPIRRLHPAPAQSQATEIEARAAVAACDQQLARYREALTTAMRAVFAELRAQVLRPPSGELLDAVEYVVECWDHLARVLS
ncbi:MULTISPECIES: hypothetical protein [Kitasatospora]|uniref:hypothetical protein n=1 Tax=Kitasatospora TaxID=2063 RepID=UPI000CA8D909|nr:hypothetical protein [Kitasatospora sp. GP30]MDH6140378.1 hypothetical protein [Kitasatospora sp. GP30]